MDPLTTQVIFARMSFEGTRDKTGLLAACLAVVHYAKSYSEISAMVYPWLFVITFFMVGRCIMAYLSYKTTMRVKNEYAYLNPGVDDSVPFGSEND